MTSRAAPRLAASPRARGLSGQHYCLRKAERERTATAALYTSGQRGTSRGILSTFVRTARARYPRRCPPHIGTNSCPRSSRRCPMASCRVVDVRFGARVTVLVVADDQCAREAAGRHDARPAVCRPDTPRASSSCSRRMASHRSEASRSAPLEHSQAFLTMRYRTRERRATLPRRATRRACRSMARVYTFCMCPLLHRGSVRDGPGEIVTTAEPASATPSRDSEWSSGARPKATAVPALGRRVSRCGARR